MFIDPNVGERIEVAGKALAFTEAADAPGILYAEIGHKAKVYRVIDNDGKAYALKAFKPRYRSDQVVDSTQRITAFASLPGLSVANRSVITPPSDPELVQKYPAFAYAILMPWVEGKSWSNYVAGKIAISRIESLSLARALANILSELEQRNLAHCDLSSSNFIFSPDFQHVELIDIEDMFGFQMLTPAEKPTGTGGYAPEWIKPEGAWEAGADRFQTGILLSEILAWQFDDIRAASDDASFFADGEFGHKSKRFRLMADRLGQIHPKLADLFKTVWYAGSIEECPRIADWKRILDAIRDPVMIVEPAFLDFGTLDLRSQPARDLQLTLTVKNTGGGILKGEIQSHYPWLLVSPGQFLCPERESSLHQVTLKSTVPIKKGQTQFSFSDGISVCSQTENKSLSGSFVVRWPQRRRFPIWGYAFIIALIVFATVAIFSPTTSSYLLKLFIQDMSTPVALIPPSATPSISITNSPTVTPFSSTVTPTQTITPTATQTITITPQFAVGSTRTSEKDKMVQVYIPEGEFIMGVNNPEGEIDETPSHRVWLSSYWIDKTEVTNIMFFGCVRDKACDIGQFGFLITDAQLPATYVNWDQADAYCKWAGKRLPTEAEWEKAAKGNDERKYPWGNLSNKSCLSNNGKNGIAVVGNNPCNISSYGVLDMAGNVMEWVVDWYKQNYYNESPYNDPTGPDNGNNRVLRGGSWENSWADIRVSKRFSKSPNVIGSTIGFRCVSPK